MNISVLTLFPELYKPFFNASLMKRASEKGLISCHTENLLSYADPKKRIDDTTFGHNAGMLIKPDIIEQAVERVEEQRGKAYKIFLSPQGRKLNQTRLKQLYDTIQKQKHVMFVASRYEGIDARVEEHYADDVISIGDFVVMGGDIPAMLLMEGLLRFVPGVVGNEESVMLDSFSTAFVDHPEYTRPVVWKDKEVPEVLRSGNHAAIVQWRQEKAAEKTVKDHFQWFRSYESSIEDKRLARKYIPSHYVALLHGDMNLKEGRVGSTSVTSIDIHDIARSGATYDIKNFFVVTPLKDQQALVQTMIDFWLDDAVGGAYNEHRHYALKRVRLEFDLDGVIDQIEKKEGKKPIIIGTSARDKDMNNALTYFDQSKVWNHDRPVLFLFGTGSGMSDKLLDRCDYMLLPVKGLSSFNHLSVRSAAAIILDKWLGIAIQK